MTEAGAEVTGRSGCQHIISWEGSSTDTHSWLMSVFPGGFKARAAVKAVPSLASGLGFVSPRLQPLTDTLSRPHKAHIRNALKAQGDSAGPSCTLESQNVRIGRDPAASGPTLSIYQTGNRYGMQRAGRHSFTAALTLDPPFLQVKGKSRVALWEEEEEDDDDGIAVVFLC